MKLFIGCASSDEIDEKYIEDCREYIGSLLINHDLVFGAYNKGLMKICYNKARLYNSNITAVCPKAYESDTKEIMYNNLIITDGVIDRTRELISQCDAIIILPGGIGTLHELFSAIDSKRCKEMLKPIIIYNSFNYYDGLFEFLEKVYSEKFSDISIKDCYHVSNSIEDTLSFLNI